MSQNFAQVVEDVKQLSSAEKEELHQLLKKYLIEEKRRQILENYKTGLGEMQNDQLTVFTDTDSLLDFLSDD
jgi:flagellar motor switch protein FliG